MQKEHRSQRASCMSCTAQHIHLLLIKESLIYGFQSSHLKRWCGSLGMTKDWYHPLDLSVPLLAIYCLPIMLHVYTGIIDAPFNPCLFLGLFSILFGIARLETRVSLGGISALLTSHTVRIVGEGVCCVEDQVLPPKPTLCIFMPQTLYLTSTHTTSCIQAPTKSSIGFHMNHEHSQFPVPIEIQAGCQAFIQRETRDDF